MQHCFEKHSSELLDLYYTKVYQGNTAATRHQKRERLETNDDKTNATYETTEQQQMDGQ